MSSINQIVNTTVATGSAGTPRAGFSAPLLFALFAGGTQLKAYTSLAEVAADHATSSAPYKMAQRLLGDPTFKPSTFYIGRRSTEVAQVVQLTVSADFVSGNSIAMTVNGQAITVPYNTSSAQTLSDLADAIAALDSIETAADTAGPPRIIDVTGETDDPDYGGGVTITGAVVTGGASQPTITQAETTALVNAVTDLQTLSADLALSSRWYAFCSDLRTDTRIQLIADWAASSQRLYVWQSNTAALYDPDDSTDVGSVISTAANDRAVGLYYSDDAVYADAAWLGRQIAIDVDNQTTIWRYVRLQRVTYDNLTGAQEAALEAKSVNYYSQLETSRGAVQAGVTGAGNPVDQRVGLDWLRRRSTEDLVRAIVSATERGSKIPHTPSGYSALAGVALARLRQGVRTGFLTDEPLIQDDGSVVDRTPRVEVTAPTSDDRAARRISMTAYGWLAGAIEEIQLYAVTLEV